MATKHTVAPGDWIGAIAHAHGFKRWSDVWDHDVNAELRALRKTPNMLMVGDEVNIPGPEDQPGIDVASGQRVVFVARAQDDVLRLRLDGLAPFVKGLGPLDFKLEVGDQTVIGTIEKEQQIIEAPLPPSATEATLTLGGEMVLKYAIGGLGPAEEVGGARARLKNLSYQQDDDDEIAFRTYQRWRGLEPTGQLDGPTLSEIITQYGD